MRLKLSLHNHRLSHVSPKWSKMQENVKTQHEICSTMFCPYIFIFALNSSPFINMRERLWRRHGLITYLIYVYHAINPGLMQNWEKEFLPGLSRTWDCILVLIYCVYSTSTTTDVYQSQRPLMENFYFSN